MVVTPLRETFAEPFGPWKDHNVLSHKLQTTIKQVLELNELFLSQGAEPAGLDATDLLPPDPDSADHEQVSSHNVEPVFFRGVLHIRQPFERLFDKRAGTRKDNVLTDTGFDLLVRQWRERADNERWKDSHLRDIPVLKIKLVGRVSNSVRFLEANDKYAPDGLKITTQYPFGNKLQRRVFRVNTMEASTYNLSRTYLARVCFLRTLRNIVKDDNSRTLPESRDLEWAMTRYVTRSMHMPGVLETMRPFFDHKDRDLKTKDLGSDRVLPDGTFRKGRKRIPRTRAITEVRSYFAVFTPWLLNHSAETHIRRLNLNLEAWSRQTMRLRDVADVAWRSHTGSSFGVDWTVPHLEQQDSEVAAFRSLVKQGRIKNAGKLKQKPPVERSLPPIISDPLAEAENEDDADFDDREYSDQDTDPEIFTSEEEASDLEADDMGVLSRVPTWGMNMPIIQDDGLWHCPHRTATPGEECGHTICLSSLKPDELKCLPAPIAQVLQSRAGQWRFSDPWVFNALRKIVDEHYDAHLEQLNIRKHCKLKQGRVHVSFEWINAPRRPVMYHG